MNSKRAPNDVGANEVIDCTKVDFAELLSDYDVVLDSLGGENLTKSLTVLRTGGLAISVVSPPDAALADQLGSRVLFRRQAWVYVDERSAC